MRKLTFALHSAFYTLSRITFIFLFVATLSSAVWGQCTPQANSITGTVFEDKENEFYSITANGLEGIKDPKKLYEELTGYNPYKPKAEQGYSMSFHINDSTKTSFFVQLPEAYSPEKKYSLLFILHGAIRYGRLADYQEAEWNLGGWNRFYTKFATQNEVIMVFPKGSKVYNWMIPNEIGRAHV